MTNPLLHTFLLIAAAISALVLANSGFAEDFNHLLHYDVGGNVYGIPLHAPLHFVVNDILMAIFFLAVGCEIKREITIGELSTRSQALFPVIGAIGGMAVPALFFILFNINHPEHLRGWAIPSATDIAFSLGVLGFVHSAIPRSLRVFLTALAIVDDLGAVLIIAVFFTGSIEPFYFGVIAVCSVILFLLGRRSSSRTVHFLLFAPLIWLAFYRAGIHPTVAGVFLALFIPIKNGRGERLLEKLEHLLLAPVALVILPLFAFFNSGISLKGMNAGMLLDPIPLGVALGLFLGKQIGVFGLSFAGAKLGFVQKPEGASWFQLYSISVLTGIGFTMSIFVAGLAFADPILLTEAKLGIFAGSILSAIIGLKFLNVSLKRSAAIKESP